MALSEKLQRSAVASWRSIRGAAWPSEGASPHAAEVASLAVTRAPVIWLVGKVQSGKTSIVRALTGASAAEIGEGYKACTRTASVFDFPAEAPVIRFLDTRGLGEAGYDPAADLAVHEGKAHLLLAVMRALDPQQDPVIDALAGARAKHPSWPLIVAQTTLHDAYAPAQADHLMPYPFDMPIHALAHHPGIAPDLVRSLAYQRRLFSGIAGAGPILFVPIDFTKPGDGFEPEDYGLPALLTALEAAAPAGLVAALKDAHSPIEDALAATAHPHIMGYAAAAAAADAVPAAGVVAVPVIQSKMLHSVGRIYGVRWTRNELAEFAAGLGAGAVSRLAAQFGLRQLVKLIPVYGQTAGAAAAAATSFATTFAIGKAACYFLRTHRAGISDPSGVADAYAVALKEAFTVFRLRKHAGRIA